MKYGLIVCVAVIGVLATGVAPAFAGQWVAGGGRVGASGNADNFSWTDGKDDNGRFGSPFLVGDTFLFTTSFLAESAGDQTVNDEDTVYVDLLANSGMKFSGMTVTAFGSYNITGPGGVDVTANLSASENDGLMRSWNGPLATTPLFPIEIVSGSTNGNWDGSSVIDIESIFPEPSDNIHIEMHNNVIAFSSGTGSASINAQFQDLAIEFTLVPEPACLALVAMGGLMLACRRRR